jgi:hypothetical protein
MFRDWSGMFGSVRECSIGMFWMFWNFADSASVTCVRPSGVLCTRMRYILSDLLVWHGGTRLRCSLSPLHLTILVASMN